MKKLIAISVFALAYCGGAFAQVAGMGAISGTVRDASGAVIPDAQVIVSNESKGIKRTINTTEAGVFAAPSLVPAPGYSLMVTKQGFSNYEIKDLQVQVGQNVDLAIGRGRESHRVGERDEPNPGCIVQDSGCKAAAHIDIQALPLAARVGQGEARGARRNTADELSSRADRIECAAGCDRLGQGGYADQGHPPHSYGYGEMSHTHILLPQIQSDAL